MAQGIDLEILEETSGPEDYRGIVKPRTFRLNGRDALLVAEPVIHGLDGNACGEGVKVTLTAYVRSLRIAAV